MYLNIFSECKICKKIVSEMHNVYPILCGKHNKIICTICLYIQFFFAKLYIQYISYENKRKEKPKTLLSDA